MEMFLESREWLALCLVVEQKLEKRKETSSAGGWFIDTETFSTFSYMAGTDIKQGPFQTVEKRIYKGYESVVTELETFGTYINGKLEGEFIQKKWLPSHAKGVPNFLLFGTVSTYEKGVKKIFLQQ